MKKIITICAVALSLAGCGSRTKPASEPTNAATKTDMMDKLIPSRGSDTTLPAKGGAVAQSADTTIPTTGEAAPGVIATPEQRALVIAIQSVPQDKRRQLDALLECEERKLPGGVKKADRPVFMKEKLAALNADPLAVAHCRAGGTTTTQ